jgi:coronatine-insensitive protein 1
MTMNSAIVAKFLAKHSGSQFKRQNSKKKCLSLDETLDLIFSYLDPEDRASASLVCKQWHRVDGETRKYVSVSNCYAAPPSALSKRFPNIERFKIKGKPRAVEFNLLVDDWGGYASAWVEEIVRAFPRLHALHFRRMDVSDNDLKIIAQGCRSLQVNSQHF